MLDAGGSEDILGTETRMGRISWSTPSTKLSGDARARIAKLSSGKTAIHIFPWSRKVANVLDADATPPPDADTATHQTPQHHLSATNYAKHRQSKWNKTSPAADKNSLSEFAESFLADSSEACFEQALGMEEFAENPQAFDETRAENMASIRTLLEHGLGRVDATVGTPVALA
ncbi:hypothetical protein EDB81DRAFT_152699 [Dactylonectria macrodidyma]|uniref:Uncharacterized protein n=1 Tax=Dactylonectria macrodidyma TaxID=307937 RepID=A0A9P9JL32_9HYPO|nr:hypothetical protein EDB81DRAFT_152699 [Dactylonectria macrodidyma]